jgi:hypothetical protein
MMTLTKAQRKSLKKVFDRRPLYVHVDERIPHQLIIKNAPNSHPASYRQFRKTVVPELGGWGAAMVPWSNMWLGIEKDGHVHS